MASTARPQAWSKRPPRTPDLLGHHRHIEGREVLGHHRQDAPGQAHPQNQSQETAHQAAGQAFGQEQEQHLARGHAQGPEQADLPAAAHHRQGNGLVDQKHAHEQGDGAQHRQIEAVGGHQALGAAALRGRPHHLHPGRQRRLEAFLDFGRGPGPDHVDIIEAPHPIQEFLGRADIHEQHCPVQGIEAALGGEYAGYPESRPPGAHHHRQGVPDLQSQTGRQRPAHQDRVGPG